MMENSESEEDIEEVKEDNAEAAKKQHSSKARGKKWLMAKFGHCHFVITCGIA
jgi:hypothetical protein